jgi:hypothetical protein
MKKQIVRVTEILADNHVGPDWSMVSAETMEAKSLLGTSVHRLCAQFADGRLNIEDSPAWDYARAFIKWLTDSGAKVLRSEFEIKEKVAGLTYIGHPDVEFDWKGERWLADIKTGVYHKSHDLQLAGYDGPRIQRRRGILKLTPTSAKLIPLKDTKAADQAWAACCTLYRWRNS